MLVLVSWCARSLCLLCSPVWAGDDQQTGSSASRPKFLSRYEFHLNLAALSGSLEQFAWDADFGGGLDFIDYGKGRISASANYETIMGSEFQPFDPNQGNYKLEVVTSHRFGERSELSGVFSHVSRHFGDRVREFPIDWNMAGLGYSYRHTDKRFFVESRGRVLWTTLRSFVDYKFMAVGGVSGRYSLTDSVEWIGGAEFTTIGVERTVRGRGTQRGGYVESGVRLAGGAAAVEFFLAFERRIDADARDLSPRSWAMLGFRLVPR